jgi:hypothetical protein
VNEQPFETEDQHLQPAWLALEQRLKDAEMLGPRAGFSRRWLARYKAQPARDMRPLVLALANGTATLVLFAVLLPGLRPFIAQPGSLLANVAEYVTKLMATLLVVIKTFASVAAALPPAAWLLIGCSTLALLAFSALVFSKMDWNKGETK